jgi:adenylosuccinate synthase
VVGIVKAYSTRVGSGPFPTELTDAVGERLRAVGREYGATTGRPRRCGWLDLVALRHAARTSGIDAIALTKLDVLADLGELQVCVAYELDGARLETFPEDARALERVRPVLRTLPGFGDVRAARRLEDLPAAARGYLDLVTESVGARLALVSVGPGRGEDIEVFDPFGG